jgi:hypothetical protein
MYKNNIKVEVHFRSFLAWPLNVNEWSSGQLLAPAIFLPWRNSPCGPRPSHYRGFVITLRHITVGRTPPDEWSARRRDLYLTTHNSHKGPTSMPHAGFEPTFPASERPQTHALNCTMPRLLPNGNIRRCPFSRRLYGPRANPTAVEMREVSATQGID